MQIDHQGNGPQKRRAPDDNAGGLSLETIREAIGEAIRGELHEVRKDIRHFAQRVDHVESQVTKQVQQTINLLDEMTNKHAGVRRGYAILPVDERPGKPSTSESNGYRKLSPRYVQQTCIWGCEPMELPDDCG